MSVLIKGETLPKCCYTCPISNYDEFLDELFCNYNGNVTQFLVNRHPNCPLVDVPTPHGRLIDADKLKEYWQPDHGKVFNADYFIHTIETAKTVIMAESEGT